MHIPRWMASRAQPKSDGERCPSSEGRRAMPAYYMVLAVMTFYCVWRETTSDSPTRPNKMSCWPVLPAATSEWPMWPEVKCGWPPWPAAANDKPVRLAATSDWPMWPGVMSGWPTWPAAMGLAGVTSGPNLFEFFRRGQFCS